MNTSLVLTLVRCRTSEYGTFGRLFIGENPVCYTLEPPTFVLYPCIPLGSYKVTLKIESPKFRYRFPYSTLCKGRVPRLLNVPHRKGILFHIGCYVQDTKGCILVGERASLTRLYNSTNAFIKLYNELKKYDSIMLYITELVT